MRAGMTRVAAYSSKLLRNVPRWRRSKDSTAGSLRHAGKGAGRSRRAKRRRPAASRAMADRKVVEIAAALGGRMRDRRRRKAERNKAKNLNMQTTRVAAGEIIARKDGSCRHIPSAVRDHVRTTIRRVPKSLSAVPFAHTRARARISRQRQRHGENAMPKAYWITDLPRDQGPGEARRLRQDLRLSRSRLTACAISAAATRRDLRGRAERAARRLRISQPRKGDRRARRPGLQEALRALGDGAVRDIRIIEGLD